MNQREIINIYIWKNKLLVIKYHYGISVILIMNISFLSLHDVTALHGAEINEAVQRVVNGGWYLQSKENEMFEHHYAEFVGTKYCVGCANALYALIWIFRAYIEMGVMQPGDEVIVPANTYFATILAITKNGLKPILIESKPNTLEIGGNRIEDIISSKTHTIAIVHLYSRNAYTDKIGELCKKYDLKHVEDNAQAHGGKALVQDSRLQGQLAMLLGIVLTIAPHKQKCYTNADWNTPQLSLTIIERPADEELSLPIGQSITMEEVV